MCTDYIVSFLFLTACISKTLMCPFHLCGWYLAQGWVCPSVMSTFAWQATRKSHIYLCKQMSNNYIYFFTLVQIVQKGVNCLETMAEGSNWLLRDSPSVPPSAYTKMVQGIQWSAPFPVELLLAKFMSRFMEFHGNIFTHQARQQLSLEIWVYIAIATLSVGNLHTLIMNVMTILSL